MGSVEKEAILELLEKGKHVIRVPHDLVIEHEVEGTATRRTVVKEDKPIEGNVVDIGEKTIEEVIKT